MTTAVAHRGPDGQGFYTDGPLALGHRRLAIVDLSDDARQPMSYADGRYVIVYNGEVYNHLELRKELESVGFAFRSHSDTEVMLAAYARWGETCVSRFNGMWAFALHDRVRNVLFCSRDRFGVKPFYYVDTPTAFAFGSEIRQLLPVSNRVAARRDLVADFILTNGADFSAETFFEGVKRLPAGHNLVYDLGAHRFAIKPWYSLARRDDVAALSVDAAVEAFREVLDDAVRLRLRADVPVGTCLSGGLDSSTVATLAARRYEPAAGRPFAAVTAESEDERVNESHYAEIVARHSGMSWLCVRPTYDDLVGTLPDVVRAQEEPFGSPSLTMQYHVMKTARANGLPVLLDGQGGDETLLGYEKYYAAYVAGAYRRAGLGGAVRALTAARAANANMGIANLAKYVIGGTNARARYAYYLRTHDYLRVVPPLPERLAEFARATRDEFALQSLEIRSTNLPVLLRFEDKNSMAHAVEARLPFLDYRVVETALSLPGEYKIRDGWSKWILRKSMAGRMPDEIVWRRNKLGFESPEELWLPRHLPTMRSTVLGSPLLGELCDLGRLGAKYDRLDRRSQWRLYSVALWESAFHVAA
jgi:asparagine synthase (glutamine-hydrolysing)